MAQKVKINGKEYSCSKEVAEHIKWLEIQVKVSKDIADETLEKLDEVQINLNSELYKLGDYIKQIKPI